MGPHGDPGVPRDALDEIRAAIRSDPVHLVLAGGASVLAIIGAEIWRRFGIDPAGKAEVVLDGDDERTAITITWPGSRPAEPAPDGDREDPEAPETAEAAVRATQRDLNAGRPVRWTEDPAPGGWACAVPAPGNPAGICGIPVESEPCTEHRDQDWRPE